MRTHLLPITMLCASLCFAGAAVAEEPLVTFEMGHTHLDCELANHALAEGYFAKIVNPRITGTCQDVEPTKTPEPVVVTPIVPGVSPIAPWCDCTDEEWQAMRSLMAEQKILINPGFESANPAADWAEAFKTDTATIRSPDFWDGGKVPAFEELSDQRFLELK